MNAALVNRLWLWSAWDASKKFHAAANDVAETQAQILQAYLTRNRDTAYLTQYAIRSIAKHPFGTQHATRLPLTTYDDYLPHIERIANGEQNILTAEPVRLFEPSSGSTAASKMIPYTRTLQREFQRGLSAWITDLYAHHPALTSGAAYWSVSPLTEGPRRTPGGIPIGFEDDSAYLGALGGLVESALAVPSLVKHIRSVDAFRYVTLLFLLKCEDLRLISVWNPTFLTLLLAPMPQWWESLLRDLTDGTITPPVPIDERIHRALLKTFAPYALRSKQSVTRLSRLQPTDYASIWRNLALISCWGDGASKSYAKDLQEKFPNVIIQPKGLLATEAFVSFPLVGHSGGALAVTSHYFEFLSEAGDLLPAHRVEKDRTYSVVVTTGGGLYRYQVQDVVEVTGFYGEIPLLKFIGKADNVSDYFGEKLNERFAAHALERLFSARRLSPAFFLLAPDDADGFRYILYIELPNHPTMELRKSLAAGLDSILRENFHYDYCRRLGQLNEPMVVAVARGAETYLNACQARGIKLGNIKPGVLQKSTGWGEWFELIREF
jgi:hypothetical protein